MTNNAGDTGQRVFVFGGTSGINLGIAAGFAAVGARVGIAGRKPAKVNAAAAQLSSSGREVLG